MGLDVVDAEYFAQGTIAAFSLEKACVGVVIEGNLDISLVVFHFQILQHKITALPVPISPSATHVIEQHTESEALPGLELAVELLEQVLLQLSRAQVQRTHVYAPLAGGYQLV